jgi:hypothetical protein
MFVVPERFRRRYKYRLDRRGERVNSTFCGLAQS